MITGRASALVMVAFETISKRGFTTHHSVIQGQTKLGSHEKFFFLTWRWEGLGETVVHYFLDLHHLLMLLDIWGRF